VIVTTAEAADALYVPTSAVRPGPDGTYTIQVKDGSGTRTRAVQIGIRGDQYVQIRSGLTANDEVVVTPSAGASPDTGFPAA
jgi:HlyD family secretion protein